MNVYVLEHIVISDKELQIKFDFRYGWPTFTWVIALCLKFIFRTFLVLYDFHVCRWKNTYIKDLNALRILMNSLCIYLGERRGAFMHNECICIGTHSHNLYYRTACWMFTKLGRYDVLMAPHMPQGVSALSTQGQIQGRTKISRGPLLQKTSFSDRKATATNRMYSNDLEACGMKCCYFWFNSNFFKVE